MPPETGRPVDEPELWRAVERHVMAAGISPALALDPLRSDVARSPDPHRSLRYLVRFLDAGFSTSLLREFVSYPVLQRVLVALLSQSQYLADILVRDPQLFLWLTASDALTRMRTSEEVLEECRSAVALFQRIEKKIDAVKRVHRREFLRIGAREILREADVHTTIRGIEGEAARTYFGAFNHCITAGKEDFFFHERSRRPPLGNMNALLSFLYTLLAHDVAAALEGVGLDPAVGFLHRDRPGRPGLALDIMEEFRPFLADRLALSLVNRRQINGKGFRKTETGSVLMTDETRKEVIVAWQKRKQEEIRHPFLDEAAPIGLLPHLQAMLLARHLRGDLDGYPPFLWR